MEENCDKTNIKAPNIMDEPLPESKIDEQIINKDDSSSNKGFYKIASAVLFLLIIYFTYLIYNKL